MKTLKSILAFTLLVVGFVLFCTSCKKDKATPIPIKPPNGKFLGHFSVTNDPTENYMSFSFNTDKTLIVYADNNFGAGAGSWSLTEDVLTGEFYYDSTPGTKFAFTAKFNSQTGVIASGTWGFKPNVAGAATFTMTKQEPLNRYEGTYQIAGSSGTYPLAFELYADGSVLFFENPQDLTKPSGSGIYTLPSNTFNALIKYFISPSVTYAYTAAYSVSALSNGTWGVSPQTTGYGMYSAAKK
jgi:hypothetical protein